MILVVEDDADCRACLLALLRGEGYRGVPCVCGGDALAFLKDNQPPLVILDLGLPDLNGLSVFRAIRAQRRLDDTRVLMFSAYDGALREEALAAGVDGYLLKGSLDCKRLRAEIRRLAGPPTGPRGANA